MSSPEVSVVVPVYNTWRYLDRCIESIVAQSFKNIEIILVNDGSTDSSLELCQKWAERDDRIRVVTKENGGLSSARNAGAQVARAPYVGFVDSDDFVEPDMYERLLRNLRDHDADISVCGLRSCYRNRSVERPNTGVEVMSNVEAMEEMISHRRLHVCAVVKLYPTRLVLEHPFKTGLTSEDVYFLSDIYPHVRKVVVDTAPCYNWWHHEGSITTKPFDSSCLDVVRAYEYCSECLAATYPELESAITFRRMWARFSVLDRIARSSNSGEPWVREIERQMIFDLKERDGFIRSCPYFGRGRKIAYRLLLLHPFLYKLAVRFQSRRNKTYSA